MPSRLQGSVPNCGEVEERRVHFPMRREREQCLGQLLKSGKNITLFRATQLLERWAPQQLNLWQVDLKQRGLLWMLPEWG